MIFDLGRCLSYCIVFLVCLTVSSCTNQSKIAIEKVRSHDQSPTKIEENDSTQAVKYYFQKGLESIQKEQYDSAINYYQKIIEIMPENFDAYYNLGLSYAKKSSYTDAIIHWEIAKDIEPNNANVYFNLASAYKYTKDYDKAMKYYEKYLELKPNDQKAQNELNSLLEKQIIGTGIIGRVFISDSLDQESKKIIKHKGKLPAQSDNIYCMVEVIQPTKSMDIIFKLVYEKDQEEYLVNTVNTNVTDDSTILTTVSKPDGGWPIGKYEAQILVDGITNVTVPFKILK